MIRLIGVPPMAGKSGYYLSTDGVKPIWDSFASSTVAWGHITGTLSAQTDLQTVLNTKVQLANDLGGTITSPVVLSATPAAASSGTPTTFVMNPAANTGITTTANAPQIVVSTSTQTWATGSVAEADYFLINAPTFAAAGASTFAIAATLTITGAPIAGTNATITQGYALNLQGALLVSASSGTVPGGIQFGTTAAPSPSNTAYINYNNGFNWNAPATGFTLAITGVNVLACGAHGNFTFTPQANTTGAPTALNIIPANNTGVTTTANDPQFVLSTSTITWATGTVAQFDYAQFNAPTIAAAAASTFTMANTVTISGAPIAGSNATITTGNALYVTTGNISLGAGSVVFGSATAPTSSLVYINWDGTQMNLNVSSGKAARFTIGGTSVLSLNSHGNALIAPIANNNGTPFGLTITPAANTSISTTSNSPQFILNTSTQSWATGAVAEADYMQINAPTFAATGASTFTLANTLTISGPPIAGTNVTITAAYAFYVTSGNAFVSGTIASGTGIKSNNYDSNGSGTTNIKNSGSTYLSLTGTGSTLFGVAQSSGTPFALTITPAANTGITTTDNAPQVVVSTSTQTWATGTVAEADYIQFNAPTLTAAAASTFTQANTLYISGAPIAGTNATITTGYALNVAAGFSLFGGGAIFGSNSTNPTGSTAYINQNTNTLFNYPNTSSFNLTASNTAVISLTGSGNATFEPIASSSGNHTAFTFTPPANTGGSTTVEHSQFIMSSSTQTNAAGTVALWRYVQFQGPKFDFATSSTATVVSNVDVGMVGANSNNAIFGTVYGLRVNPTSSQSSAITASFIYAGMGVAAGTLTLNGTTEITSNDISALRLDVLTITDASAITVDSAAALTIVGAPVAGGSVTLTNSYAINVKGGNVLLVGTSGNTLQFTNSVAAPTTSTVTLTTTVYGSNAAVLTTPTTWVMINQGGTNYRVPAYA